MKTTFFAQLFIVSIVSLLVCVTFLLIKEML